MSALNIVVVDYKMSNIFNIRHVFSHLGYEVRLSSSAAELKSADALVMPGVGAFGEAMTNLHQLDLIQPIKEFIAAGKPFLGICLGLQLLFSKSYEFGVHEGLNIIAGEVLKFPEVSERVPLRVPHVGWNQIVASRPWSNTALMHLRSHEFVYFLHSYYARPKNKQCILSTTTYGGVSYCSSIQKDNIFALQFHPEKSGTVGLLILKNWLSLL